MKLKARSKRLLRALGILPPRDVPGSPRNLGDLARDSGDWANAAVHYADHLQRAPRDFGIQVQLGHALKETGRLADADDAYARARSLKPRNADLLINYGHLKKMRRQYAGAAQLYAEAARIERGGFGLVELGSHLLEPHLTPEMRELRRDLTRGSIANRFKGVSLLDQSGVLMLDNDRVIFTDHDPWFELRLETTGRSALGVLTLKMQGETADRPPVQTLYLDYGAGYRDDQTIALPPAIDGQVSVILAHPARLRSIRWDPDNQGNIARLTGVSYQDRPDIDELLATVRARQPDNAGLDADVERLRKALLKDGTDTATSFSISSRLTLIGAQGVGSYAEWLRRWVEPRPQDYERIAELTTAMSEKPRFSFVMPVYNPPPELLVECIDSLLAQTYQDFEICIADDRSPNPEIRTILETYAARDSRVKLALREYNGHISSASNSALALATGDFIVLVDHDDLVPDYCLFVVAWFINQNPQAEVLFSDEDKITIGGHRYDPYFKGEFDPFLMFGHNMVSHLGVYRRSLIEAIGGFRRGLEGSQDYDLVLRAIERISPDAIVHIPYVLYHWRAIPGSTALSGDEKSYAVVAAQQAVNGHFERTGLPLRSVDGLSPGVNAVKASREYDTPISIIIPTRNGLDVLKPCIESILAVDHANTEILIVDNGSDDPVALNYLAKIQSTPDANIKVLAYPHPFNFSEINNFAAEHATGDILCFLNNDTEVIAGDWLARARGLLALPDVGIVGARLLFPDATVQHFGVATGMAQHRVASTPHVGLHKDAGGYFGKARLLQQFSSVTAACLFVKAEVFRAVDGYEPSLRVAYNDIDLCLKVRKAGHKVVADPQILLTHKESKSRGSDQSGAKADRLQSEADIMHARWGETLLNDPFYSPNHDLDFIDFRLASPPRRPMPWRIGDDGQDVTVETPVFSAGRGYLSNLWATRRPLLSADQVEPGATCGIGAVIRAGAASSAGVLETLASLKAQVVAPRWIAILDEQGTGAGRDEAADFAAVHLTAKDFAKGMKAALGVGPSDQIMILNGGDRLEPEALARFDRAFLADVGMVYSDALVTGEHSDEIVRFLIRPAFTHDGYLSHPYFNRGLAIERSLVEGVVAATRTAVKTETDLILRCIEGSDHVAHIPAVLYRLKPGHADDGVSKDALAVLDRHLAKVQPKARAAAGLLNGSYRIDYPDDGGKTLIVIPTKDGVDLLRTCINSVRRTTTGVDIVIVDHASVKPETLDYFKSLDGDVRIDRQTGPFNFSALNNRAVERFGAGYDYVVFMNNDIEAIEAGWLERMRSLAARPEVGVIGSTLLYANRTVQHAGVVLGVGGCAAHGQSGADFERAGRRNAGFEDSLISTRDYSAVTAACMMMRMEVFQGVGGFDEDLAVGFNDTDLCLRVGGLGYAVLNDAHTVLYHHESATRSKTDDLSHPEDAVRFLHRWKRLITKGDPFYSPLLSLTSDYELQDVTDMSQPERIRPVRPTLLPLRYGRPGRTAAPARYQEGEDLAGPAPVVTTLDARRA